MRPARLATGALVLVCACRADTIAPEPSPPVTAPAVASPTEVEPPIAIAPTVASPTVVAATPTDAPPVVAAPSGVVATTTDDGPPAGCIERVDDLPEATFLRRDDRRLRGDALVVVAKSARRLMLFTDGASTGCWRVALGFAPAGHKSVQGDGRTPEGWYRTSDKPWSSFDNAIAIHYPNAGDARVAAADGRIGRRTRDAIVDATEGGKIPPQSTALGGAVLIHGGGSSSDWTLGCVALDDAELLSLRDRLPAGMRTDLLILP